MKTGNQFLWIFAFILVITGYVWAGNIEIKVDASKDTGRIPDILSSSVWIDHPQDKDAYILDKFFRENRPAVIQITIPLGGTDFSSFKEELKNYLSNAGVSAIRKKVNEYNSVLVVGFDPAPMRPWLSSRRGDHRFILKDGGYTVEQTSPPQDYTLWGEVVKYTLNYLKKDLGIKNLGFYVGHEPNRDWLGSEESFFKYYEFAAQAAKSVSESISVGGMGTWYIDGEKVDCGYPDYADYVRELCKQDGGWGGQEPMLKNFIGYIASRGIPLDFINWHSFGEPPERFIEVAATIKGWLKDAGIDEKKVKLHPCDWTYWSDSYPADYLDTQESAAYIIHSLYFMWKAGIHWHGHDFNVFDEAMENDTIQARRNATFVGDWSVFTWGGKPGGGIIKPMYNALKALSIATWNGENMTRRLISTEFPEEDTVVAFSTLTDDKRKISLIASNFVPKDESRLKRYIMNKVETTINLQAEKMLIKKWIKEGKKSGKETGEILSESRAKLASAVKDPEKTEAIDFLLKVYFCLNAKDRLNIIKESADGLLYPASKKIADKITGILNAQEGLKFARVHFKHIPFSGTARLTTYKIDSNHANACSYNKKTEPERTDTPCGIGGAVDRAVWDIKRGSTAKAVEAVRTYLQNRGYANEEINKLEMQVNKHGPAAIRKHLANKNLSQEKRNDIKSIVKIYKKTMQETYYERIDYVNNRKEVSLEGSKEEEEVTIGKGEFTIDISLEPNSIYLLILEKN
ncbi:MAG: hypothetical protein HRF42_08295 [Candidatus Brocadia sp.]|jgi:hypothetical protein